MTATRSRTYSFERPAGPLLEVRDLRTWFRTAGGVVRAVDGVSFTLDRGRTLAVVGESGSGKTVLSRSVMGLLPPGADVERSGSVKFEGDELVGLSAAELRPYWGTQMSVVFQDAMTALNPVLTVGAQLMESLRFHYGISKRVARNQAIELLHQVGVPLAHRRVDEYPLQLSGGLRQRVMIAIALSCEPALLVADEPTTALDVTVQAQVLDLLQRLQAERHMAMILITHDLNVAAGRADDIAVMYAGRIVELAPASTIFASPRMPYTAALLRSSPSLDEASHTRLAVIPGRPPDLVSPPSGCRFHPRCPRRGERCAADEPPLMPDEDLDHVFACWYPEGGPTGPEADGDGEVASGSGTTAATDLAPADTDAAAGPPTRRKEQAGTERPSGSEA